ncbi:hypothetical protein AAFF_G00364010 [Aldrovandia affinis]|uniref:Uncharacterized protein n=1 Tax=Aldrovandia affinis TaxID=143900 RepID=A0AAD7SHM6_9TELE|nr:hypothetical protein AAFF_G00364010 [Aldrovandia affinis]
MRCYTSPSATSGPPRHQSEHAAAGRDQKKPCLKEASGRASGSRPGEEGEDESAHDAVCLSPEKAFSRNITTFLDERAAAICLIACRILTERDHPRKHGDVHLLSLGKGGQPVRYRGISERCRHGDYLLLCLPSAAKVQY